MHAGEKNKNPDGFDRPPEMIHTQLAKVWRDQAGIVWAQMPPDLVAAGVDDANELFAALAQISEGKKIALLADLRLHNSSISDRETRNSFSAESTAHIFSAVSVLIGSPVNAAIGNFFLRVNRPPYPLRIFWDEEPAVSWLKDFIA